MPPVVGVHEGVAVLPGVGHRLQEGHALQQPAARLEAMGDARGAPTDRGGPWRAPGAPCASASSRRLHSSRPKAYMRVDVAVVAVGREQVLADPQQRLGVAAVEGMELAELAGQQVARPFGDHLLVDREAAGRCRRRPRPRSRRARPVRAGWRRRRDIAWRARDSAWRRRVAFGRIHRQHEVGRHHRQQGAAFFLVGGGHELGQRLPKPSHSSRRKSSASIASASALLTSSP